jgi:hypothetical protein
MRTRMTRAVRDRAGRGAGSVGAPSAYHSWELARRGWGLVCWFGGAPCEFMWNFHRTNPISGKAFAIKGPGVIR